jgi:ABC-type transporter Mla subunit MlaD
MKKSLFFAILSLLFSCSSNNNQFTIKFDNAQGLAEGDKVYLNDLKIGKVTKITLDSDFKILVEIDLNDTIKIPKDSKFTIGSSDLFSKSIIVTPGKSRKMIGFNDLVKGQLEQEIIVDTLFEIVSEEINNLKSVKNQERIISEIEKLNKKLDSIWKK